MSAAPKPAPSTARSMLGAAGTLALFAAAGAAVLAFTWRATKDDIALAERQRLITQVGAVLPANFGNNPLADTLTLPGGDALGLESVTVFRARRGGAVSAVAFAAVAPDGYSGDIRLLIGVDAAGRLTGVRVVTHRETPGLGDKVEVERSDWIRSFDGRSLADPAGDGWAVKKDGGVFDQFTGATVTPRAVVAAVERALRWFAANRDALLAGPEPGA